MKTEPLVNLSYQKGKDGMLYPQIAVSQKAEYDSRSVGRFGRLWKEYMKEKHPHRLSELVALGTVNQVICQVDGEAEKKKEELIQKLLEAQPMPQSEDILLRAEHMQMLTLTAEEIVQEEVVLKVR